jgi:TorA maturation chaperone TorD
MSAEPQIEFAKSPPRGAPDPEAQARSDVYGLIAALLRRVPEAALIAHLAEMAVDDSGDDFSKALMALRLAANQVSLPEIDDEYHVLFVGLGRGELVPYASWYLTGFLMEKPLGELRRDLRLLGFGRRTTSPRCAR